MNLNPFTVVDNALVYGASKLTHANWATGETRAQLANKMLTIGSISQSVGLPPTAPLWLGIAHLHQKRNNKADELDSQANENSAIDLNRQEYHIFMSYIFGALANYHFLNQDEGPIVEFAHTLLGAGHSLVSASHFVMRTPYLPPKKNCVRRGVDKLSEMVEKYKPQPKTEREALPIPALVNNKNYLLENLI